MVLYSESRPRKKNSCSNSLHMDLNPKRIEHIVINRIIDIVITLSFNTNEQMNDQQPLSLRHGPSVSGSDFSVITTNQRMWHRVRPKRVTFAVLGCPPILIGQVIDVSMGGLSFRYFKEIELERQKYTVRIFESVGEFQMANLSCRKVYEILTPLPTEYLNLDITPKMKCCGLEFSNLTDKEINKLTRLINAR